MIPLILAQKTVCLWLLFCMAWGIRWHLKNEFLAEGRIVNTLVGGVMGFICGVVSACLAFAIGFCAWFLLFGQSFPSV